MKIYRVYHPFHSSSESGTVDYGYFSNLGMAKKRLKIVVKEFLDAEGEGIVQEEGLYTVVDSFGDRDYFFIEEIDVDEEIEKKHIGYT